MSTDGAVTELSVAVLLLSSEYSDRWSETLSPSSCVSGVELLTAGNVRAKVGDDVRTSAAVITGTVVVVLVGNTGGTGVKLSDAGIVAFAVELLRVARVE